MRRLIAVALAVFLFLALTSTGFADGANGTIKGSLANKTSGGGTVAGQEITLGTYKGSEDAGKKTTKTDKDGKFVFDGLDTGADFTYQLSVTYQEAPYYSDPINFSGSTSVSGTGASPAPTASVPTTLQTADMTVFDSTTDETVIKAPAHHFLLEPSKGGVGVTEIVIVSNSSDKTFIGASDSHAGARTTLRFGLPDGAKNFEPVDGLFPERVLQVGGGFVDTTPIYPGMGQKIWRYDIAPTGDSAAFTTKLTMAADKLSVLVPDTGATVSVAGLTGPTAADIQGAKYNTFSGQNLANGAELKFTVDGLSKVQAQPAPSGQSTGSAQPATAPASSASSPLVLAGVGLVVVVVAGTAAVLLGRRRRRSRSELADLLGGLGDESGSDGPMGLEEERQELIAVIARLDDLFEQDKISSEEYGRLRTAKKHRLVQIARMQKAEQEAVGARGAQ